MRVQQLLMLGALAALSVSAQERLAGRAEAARDAAIYNGPHTKVAMWIWSDKYIYQAGQSLTLKWTVKTNGDLYPYTVFAYRVNNQTGAKTYLPNNTATPTDMKGNSSTFEAAPLTDVTKATLASGITIPGELGMHTFVVELRDYTATHVLKSSYMKIGVVKGTTTITGDITSDKTLTNDTEWDIKGVVHVKNNATLTVEPGTFVVGQPGSNPPSVLIVTRNGKIIANGTQSRPIIMTSSLPFGQRKRGDWGGLLLLGKAPINVGANTSGGICPASGCGNAAGTFYIEGLVADDDGLYGGTDPTHNCGSLKYVRVEYAGTILSPNNELNSFTFGGCGTDTVAEHLQAIYGLDDTFEWFGGTMNAKYLVGGLSQDDYTDFQLGWVGKVQYVVGYQSPDARGNRGIEGDNSEYDAAALPYSNPTIYNATYIGSGNPGYDEGTAPGIYLRRGARATVNNTVVSNFYSQCADIADSATQAQSDAGNVKMDGILCWKNNLGGTGANGPADTLAGNIPTGTSSGAYTNAYALGQKGNGAGKNISVENPLFARPFEYSDPDWTGLFSSPIFKVGAVQPPDDGFFDQTANFMGAFGDEDWTKEWTSWLVETDIQ